MSAIAQDIPVAGGARRLALLGWLALRLPALLLVAYALRDTLFNLIERYFDIAWTTQLVIDLASTPVARLLLAVLAVAVFWGLARLATRLLGEVRGYAVALSGAALLALAVVLATGSNPIWLAPVLLPLATNWAPGALLERLGLSATTLDRIVLLAPGIGEVLFARRYAEIALDLARDARPGSAARLDPALLGAIISGVALALVVNGGALLAPVERALRSGPDVRLFAEGNINGLALSADGRRLFASGYGLDNLLRFDTTDLSLPPVESQVSAENAQAIAYDPVADEVFLYAVDSQALRVVDGATLTLKRDIPIPDLSPGDPWVLLDDRTGLIFLVSEADIQTGTPFMVIDRATGEIVERSPEEPGNLFVSPVEPVLFLSYFRRETGLAVYDIASREITARYHTPRRLDRMAYDPVRGELLVADPMAGRILAFDPQTLEPKGSFRAPFGVRSIVTDGNKLFAASLATGMVSLISLENRKTIESWYLGPWLRSIVVHPDEPVAYVSANGALYELRFGDR